MGWTPEQTKAYNQRYYQRTRESRLAAARERYRTDAAFRETTRTATKKRNALAYRELRAQIHDLLGHKCAHCGFTDKRALQVDHKNGGGVREIRAKGWHWLKRVLIEPHDFQILCANCNWIKKSERGEQPSGPPRKIGVNDGGTS